MSHLVKFQGNIEYFAAQSELAVRVSRRAIRAGLDDQFDAGRAHVYNVDNMADLLGAFEQAVLLAVWRLSKDAYGRAILKDVQSVLDRQIAAGAIYATLDRLEHKRLLDSRIEEGSTVRASRVRRYYVLTSTGIRALNESKASLEQMWRSTSWPLGTKA